jgi:ADP-heptose:LPS heptosyltransferase
MRREVFDRLGGFDESHSVINNDVDFCLRCNEAGLHVIYTPHVSLYHHELASRAELDDTYDTSSFLGTWETLFLKGDPFFNPNLSLDSDDYTLDPEPLEEVYAGYPLAAKASVRKILVVKLDHIGDFVTAIPAIQQLKALFPRSSITALVGPAIAPLAFAEPAIDEVQVFSFFHARSGLGKNEVTSADLENLRKTLEPKGFDLAIDLRKCTDTRHVLRYTGAKLTAGFGHGDESAWLDIALQWEGDPKFEQKRMHIAGDLLNLVSAVANAMREDRTVLKRPSRSALPPAVRSISRELFTKPVVCVHPASGGEQKQWPTQYFSKLIDLLVTRLNVHVVVIGSPDEAELAGRVLSDVQTSSGVWSLVGAFRLAELPAVLGAASLFVGNDSGPKHLAAGLGVPTVAIHSGINSSEEWGGMGPQAVAIRRRMECGPCYLARKEECHRTLACLTGIQPWQVFAVCKRLLSGPDTLEPPLSTTASSTD